MTEPRCDLCRRRCLDRWERGDGALVCAACISGAVDVAEAVQRGRANTARMLAHVGTGTAVANWHHQTHLADGIAWLDGCPLCPGS